MRCRSVFKSGMIRSSNKTKKLSCWRISSRNQMINFKKAKVEYCRWKNFVNQKDLNSPTTTPSSRTLPQKNSSKITITNPRQKPPNTQKKISRKTFQNFQNSTMRNRSAFFIKNKPKVSKQFRSMMS